MNRESAVSYSLRRKSQSSQISSIIEKSTLQISRYKAYIDITDKDEWSDRSYLLFQRMWTDNEKWEYSVLINIISKHVYDDINAFHGRIPSHFWENQLSTFLSAIFNEPIQRIEDSNGLFGEYHSH